MSPGQAPPGSLTAPAWRPAPPRAAAPTAMMRPSNAATSGTQPAKRTGSTSETVSLRDDLLHDLVGPRADPRQARVAPRTLDRDLAHVTVTAEDLDRVIRHLPLHLWPH